MKNILLLIVALGVSLMSGCGGCDGQSHSVNVEGLHQMSSINLLYVSVAEILKAHTRNYKTEMTYLVRGGAYYQLDLKKVKVTSDPQEEGNQNNNEKKMVIKLPEPTIYPVADQTRSEEWKVGTSAFINDVALNKIREQLPMKANEVVMKAAKQEEYMESAKEQAETIIKKLLPRYNLTFDWEKQDQ